MGFGVPRDGIHRDKIGDATPLDDHRLVVENGVTSVDITIGESNHLDGVSF